MTILLSLLETRASSVNKKRRNGKVTLQIFTFIEFLHQSPGQEDTGGRDQRKNRHIVSWDIAWNSSLSLKKNRIIIRSDSNHLSFQGDRFFFKNSQLWRSDFTNFTNKSHRKSTFFPALSFVNEIKCMIYSVFCGNQWDGFNCDKNTKEDHKLI